MVTSWVKAAVRARALVAVVAMHGALAAAQPATTPATATATTTSEILREANTAALAGDWSRVSQLIDPMLGRRFAPSDLAEAHRLSGIAAFFQQRNALAEGHFVAYLKIDLNGRLDPALYPPDVVAFFNDVASRHATEILPLRNRPTRSWYLTLLPPFGQLQNDDRIKGYVIGGLLGALLVTNLTTYALLRSWCEHTQGTTGGGLTCNDPSDHSEAARRIRPYNIASGIGAIAVYLFGVYDGIQGYRQHTRERALQPFMRASPDGSVVGVSGSF
jgi:hypothetical protein